MLRSLSCSQIDPSKNSTSNCHFVFRSSLELPDLGTRISGIVQLNLLSPLRKTLLLQRSTLSSSESLIQISQCGYRSEPPIPSLFLETGSPAKSLSTKTMILSTCFCLRNLSAALGLPPDIALHVSTGRSRIPEARSFSGPNVSLFQQDPICLGPGVKISYKQICIVLLHLS